MFTSSYARGWFHLGNKTQSQQTSYIKQRDIWGAQIMNKMSETIAFVWSTLSWVSYHIPCKIWISTFILKVIRAGNVFYHFSQDYLSEQNNPTLIFRWLFFFSLQRKIYFFYSVCFVVINCEINSHFLNENWFYTNLLFRI